MREGLHVYERRGEHGLAYANRSLFIIRTGHTAVPDEKRPGQGGPAGNAGDGKENKPRKSRKPEDQTKVEFYMPNDEHAEFVKIADAEDRGPNDMARVLTRKHVRQNKGSVGGGPSGHEHGKT